MDNIVVSHDACGDRGPYAVAPTRNRPVAVPIGARVWRELAGLAFEGLAIGLVFSVLLAAAVYMVARNAPDPSGYAAGVPVTPIAQAV
jgi:mannose/fructose/N-acetylgalactosamine-specific phosphotransferase system component IID